MVVVILGREFAVSGLRSIASAQGLVIAASGWGKAKMFTEIVAASLLILAIRHEVFLLPGKAALWLAVTMAIVSGISYFALFLRRIVSIPGPLQPPR